MKKTDNRFDNLFRKALDGHKITPSDAAKKAFLKDAADLPPARNKRRGGLIIFSTLVLFSIFGLVAWQFFDYNENLTSAKKPVVSASNRENTNTNTLQKAKTQVNIIPDKPVYVNEIAISQTRNQIHQNKNSKPENSQPKETVINKSTQPSGTSENTEAAAIEKRGDQNYQAEFIPVAEHQVIQDMPEGKLTTNANKKNAIGAEPAKEVTPMAEIQENVAYSVKASAKKSDSTKFPDVSNERSGLKRKVASGNFRTSIGVYYTPEWMFNTLEGGKFINNFGVEGIFNYGPFSIRTGAGLSIAKGTNELTVEYNDFLGAYNKLDSMDFKWNDPTHEYIPTFYMSRQDVYDSLMKLDYPKVVKRYTYLQIPLIFGYDLCNNETFSVGFRVGPLLSVLLESKQLTAEYDPGKNRIIRINDISPGQVSLNWQAMAGINGSINLNKTLKFEIEPCVKYYFNSVYEKPVNNAKPWSVGIRAALIFKIAYPQ